jgi:hypothetical protein
MESLWRDGLVTVPPEGGLQAQAAAFCLRRMNHSTANAPSGPTGLLPEPELWKSEL